MDGRKERWMNEQMKKEINVRRMVEEIEKWLILG